VRQDSKVICRGSVKARSKVGAETQGKSSGDTDVGSSGVREEVGEPLLKGLIAKPEVHPEGRGSPISQGDLGDGAKSGKPGNNILPDGSVQVMAVSQVSGTIPSVHPAEPGCPRGRGVRVDFC
jgi:hypothetical protein